MRNQKLRITNITIAQLAAFYSKIFELTEWSLGLTGPGGGPRRSPAYMLYCSKEGKTELRFVNLTPDLVDRVRSAARESGILSDRIHDV